MDREVAELHVEIECQNILKLFVDREVAELHVEIECQNILKLFTCAPFMCVCTLTDLLGFDNGTGREHKLGELIMYKNHCLFSS